MDRQSFGNSLESIKQVLSFVHQDLLKNDDSGVMTGDVSASAKLQSLNNKLQKDIANLKATRQDVKYEMVVSYYPPSAYKPLLNSISSLANDLLGFSLAIKREVRIMLEKKVKAHLDNLMNQRNNQQKSTTTAATLINRQQPQLTIPLLKPVDPNQASVLSGDTLLQGREYKDIDRLQSYIQPALKRFISTCISTLNQIESDLIQHKAITIKNKAQHTKEVHSSSKIDLKNALEEFKQVDVTFQNEYDEAGNMPTEDHFLVFTVIFTMVQFGKELIELQHHAEELIKQSNKGEWWMSRIYIPSVHLSTWLKTSADQDGSGQSLAEKVILDHRELENNKGSGSSSPGLKGDDKEEYGYKSSDQDEKRAAETSTRTPRATEGVESDDVSVLSLQRRISRIVSRIETRPDLAENGQLLKDDDEEERQPHMDQEAREGVALQNMPGRHFWNQKLYALMKWLQYAPTRYAIKFTITLELLVLLAYLPIPGVNQLYNDNHGQWALLSAMVVINYTVGTTSLICFFRIIATICGAVCGYLALLAGNRNDNPYVVAVLVGVFQIPMWYLFLGGTKYARIGFMSLLTMAVITSTGYTNTTNEAIFDPVWKRTVTAIFAIIVVMLVDQFIWPVWARKRLRTDLADLLIATGIQYSRVVSLVCQENTQSPRYASTFEETRHNQNSLTQQLKVVQEMLVLAQDEPRVTKSPFPIKEYQGILEHERNILHWIQHIHDTQALIDSRIRKNIMSPLNMYRKEMAAAVHLYLFTLACALKTKSSLPASLPSAEMARRMLQQKQLGLWKEDHDMMMKKNSQEVADQKHAEHQLFWHTYAAACVEVIVEQEAMGDIISRLMGQHVFKAATKDWTHFDQSIE